MAVQQHTFGGVRVLARLLSLPAMNRIRQAYRPTIWFKRWSRRADAAFMSLGKVVHIGSLKVDICRMALLKSGVVGLQALMLQLFGSSGTDEVDDDLVDRSSEQELLLAIAIPQAQPKVIPAAASAAVAGYTIYSDPTSKGVSFLGCGIFRFVPYQNTKAI
jgi:hypothetical protein